MAAFIIARAESGVNVAEVLRRRLGLSRSKVGKLMQQRRIFLNGKPCLRAEGRVKHGQRIEVREPITKEKKQAAGGPVIRYVDGQVVIVEKPAGLTTMRHAEEVSEFVCAPSGFCLPPWLICSLACLPRLHRAIVCRFEQFTGSIRKLRGSSFSRAPLLPKATLAGSFAHSTERCYQAIVRGRAKAGRIESCLVRDRGDGRRGSSTQPGQGQRAVTHVHILEELGDYTLVECRLETGRTHQLRIHLGESGTPICGERVYDRPVHGKPIPDKSGATRLALHAASLGFDHPETGKRMTWHSPLPRDLQDLLARLRKSVRGSPGQ